MGSSQRRLAWLGGSIGALLVATAVISASGTASASKASRTPTVGAQGVTVSIPGRPASPGVVLYDQYDNQAANATSSQNFEDANNAFDDELADDFVVPGGATWNIDQVDVAGVYFNGPAPSTASTSTKPRRTHKKQGLCGQSKGWPADKMFATAKDAVAELERCYGPRTRACCREQASPPAPTWRSPTRPARS